MWHIFFLSVSFLLRRLCFEKCYLNRGSKYKVCVGVCASVPLRVCFPLSCLLCLYLCWCVSGCKCVLCVDTCQPIKPSCVAWSARSVCCCYLRSNPALWPQHRQQTTTTLPPPAFLPFHHHHNVASGTLALTQIFHGHLPWNDGCSKRKSLRKIRPKEVEEMWV